MIYGGGGGELLVSFIAQHRSLDRDFQDGRRCSLECNWKKSQTIESVEKKNVLVRVCVSLCVLELQCVFIFFLFASTAAAAAAAANIVVLKEKNAAAAQIGNVRTYIHTRVSVC